jgi:hypothetical protein
MRDPEPPESDPELEKTIADLVYRLKRADEDSAEHRLIMRELEGLLPSELGQLIMEDHGLLLNARPVDPLLEPAQILPLSRRPRRRSGSRRGPRLA